MKKQFLQKHILLSFLLIFEILYIAYLYKIISLGTEEMQFLSKISFFTPYLMEGLVAYILIAVIPSKNIFTATLQLLLLLLFVTIHIVQLISYQISSDFITQTALNNVEFVGFLITSKNIQTVFITLALLLLIPILFTWILSKIRQLPKYYPLIVVSILVVSLFGLLFYPSIQKEKQLLQSKHIALSDAPVFSLFKLLIPKEKVPVHFSNKELALLNHAGFSFHPNNTYPLLKSNTYHSDIAFSSQVDRPNIILIFTEGTSARTMGMYNKKFKGVTPNLTHFTELNSTMTVTNYYNHTAATYKGLHGQLCSFFPSLGGRQWNKSIPNSENIHYQSLASILNIYGYHTSFLNVHLENKSGNDEMASHLGFKQVLSAEILKKKFISDKTSYREHELTDHQSYEALSNYLKAYTDKNPFLISMYTAETHAWCDMSKDGVPYANGESEVLNTLHSADDAFGKFWEYFEHSEYAKNSIVIFTSDHAHYFDDNYYKLMANYKERYHKIFIDKVPLFIYAPMLNLPQRLNVNQATSLDLTPTILHLLGIKDMDNAFLGDSLFERAKQPTHFGIAAYDSNIYIVDKTHIHHNKQTSPEGKKFFDLIAKFFEYTHQLELHDNVYPK